MKDPKILNIEAKKLIGLQTKTSLANSNTVKMWSEFMPRRIEVKNNIGDDLYSIQVYPENFKMEDFTANSIFTSWAAIEVTDFENTPIAMECRSLPGGLYAIFRHKGSTKEFHKTADFIFNSWIPDSKYEVDNREHFEILGDEYLGPNDPNSEEDVFIPIKLKTARSNEP
jgi:AraC family transcriptional regulator